MQLPKELVTVTPLSKMLALILFISLPILAFFFGMNYQKVSNEVSCTLEAKICPDGTSVGRVPPSCEFAPCPDTSDGTNPIFNTNDGKNNPNYQCPDTEYVDCEPGIGVVKSQCSPEYLQWAEKNCKGFKGAAY